MEQWISNIERLKKFKDLFYLLDDYLDKNADEWCYFIDFNHWENYDDPQYNKIINVSKEYQGNNILYYISDFNWWHVHNIQSNILFNERKEYQKTNSNNWDHRYKILWKFPTNSTILKFIDDNVWLWSVTDWNIPYIEYYYRDFNIDIEEPSEMSEQQIIKLIAFLESIKKK